MSILEKKEVKNIFDNMLDNLLSIISDVYSIPKEDIISGGNKRDYVEPRQVFSFLSINEIGAPIVKIGSFIGKHHATILHGRDVIENELSYNYSIKKRVNIIREEYKGLITKEVRDFEERKRVASNAIKDLEALFLSNKYVSTGETFEKGTRLINQLKKMI